MTALDDLKTAAEGYAVAQGLKAPAAKTAADPTTLQAAALAYATAEGYAVPSAPPVGGLSGFSVGIDVNSNNGAGPLQAGIDKYRLAFGGSIGRGMKFFDGGGGWQTAVNYLMATNYGSVAGEAIPVICSKKHDKTVFSAAMKQALGRFPLVVAIIDQEYDDEMRTAGSPTTYRNNVNTVAADRDSLGLQGKVLIGCASNTYVEMQSPGSPPITFQNMYAGLPLDVMGFDVYGEHFLPTSYALDTIKKCQAFAHSISKPWIIAEYGMQVVTTTGVTDNLTAVAGRVKAVIDYCRTDPTCRWVNYWPQPAGSAGSGLIPLLGTPVEAVIGAEMKA